jgi:hypothetical protein
MKIQINKSIMVTKEKEIAAIKSLVAMNGYFAEYFKDDVDKMVENIKNDHPIDFCTQFNAKYEDLQSLHNDTVTKHRDEIIDLCDTLLCVHEETGHARLYGQAVEKLGQNPVIARKHSMGLTLSNSEIDFLMAQLDLRPL